MLTQKQFDSAKNALSKFLLEHYGTTISSSNDTQLYTALAGVAQSYMYEKRVKVLNEKNKDKKVLHYMSIEFLLGRNLKNNLWNLGLESFYSELLKENGKNIEKAYEIEKDVGLGNGGLGRLAACYLDSLARLGYPAFGHCIKYKYGLFKQSIVDGKQHETPDDWLATGNVWLEERQDEVVDVEFGGVLKQEYIDGKLFYSLENPTIIKAIPSDMFVSGYDSNTISTLRLWEAHSTKPFNIKRFDQGEFAQALFEKDEDEAINKVLYPSDKTEKGNDLRLIQQYFLVSAAMQNVLNNYFKNHKTLAKLSKMIAVHINDTHPALCIPELMRLLMDRYGFGWDESWDAVQKVVSYTNHTILNEALEVKQLSKLEALMPRIAMIIREIDRRFRVDLNEIFKNDFRRIDAVAIISGDNVYMANLAIYASHAVNGVSKIHTHILKTKLFNVYAEIYPDKFKNVTNGITHRRWLSQINPKLDELICSLIGQGYYKNPEELRKLEQFLDDKYILNKLENIKLENKKRLVEYVKRTQGIDIDPNARFIVQAKRIHEYKRQLMNVLRIIYLCNQIRENPDQQVTPQVFIFAGKAASGYEMAKRIIKLINQVAYEVNNDPIFAGKIQVVFIENYSVSVSELLMPATEVTEQISLSGREASGTGNMKAVLNGALMMCTIDGANIEISDECSHENAFEFGLLAEDVEKIKSRGYNATEYYIKSEKIRSVLDKMSVGIGGESFSDLVDYLVGHSDYKDSYLCLADFDDYIDAYYKMDKEYSDREYWNRKVLHCIASMGQFSSDRAIEEYVSKIWFLEKNEE